MSSSSFVAQQLLSLSTMDGRHGMLPTSVRPKSFYRGNGPMSDVTGQWQSEWAVENAWAVPRKWARWLEASPTILALLAIWIGLVSAYDIYLTIKYADSLAYLEQNPLARGILNVDAARGMAVEHLARFIGFKCGGTVLAIGSLFLISNWKHHLASLAAGGVALVQLCVLLFLSFAC